MFGSCVLNEIWIIDLSSAFVRMLLSSSKLFPLSKEVTLLLELHHVIVIKYVAFFTFAHCYS